MAHTVHAHIAHLVLFVDHHSWKNTACSRPFPIAAAVAELCRVYIFTTHINKEGGARAPGSTYIFLERKIEIRLGGVARVLSHSNARYLLELCYIQWWPEEAGAETGGSCKLLDC